LSDINNPAPDADSWMATLRLRLLAGRVSLLSFGLTVVLGLAALFSRQAILGRAALTALIATLAANALIEVLRARMLWRAGAWIGMDGVRLTRAERPRMFRVWLGVHLLSAVICAGAAVALAWMWIAYKL
jgi:hypothetical protein